MIEVGVLGDRRVAIVTATSIKRCNELRDEVIKTFGEENTEDLNTRWVKARKYECIIEIRKREICP